MIYRYELITPALHITQLYRTQRSPQCCLPFPDVSQEIVEAVGIIERLFSVGVDILWGVARELAFADPGDSWGVESGGSCGVVRCWCTSAQESHRGIVGCCAVVVVVRSVIGIVITVVMAVVVSTGTVRVICRPSVGQPSVRPRGA